MEQSIEDTVKRVFASEFVKTFAWSVNNIITRDGKMDKEWKDFKFDIILANINKAIIVKLIPMLKNSQDSDILLTGLLISDKDEILDLLKVNNFSVINIIYKDEWMLININN